MRGEKELTGGAQSTTMVSEGSGRRARLSTRGRARGRSGASAGGWGLARSGEAGARAWAGDRAREVGRGEEGMSAREEAGVGVGLESAQVEGENFFFFFFLFPFLFLFSSLYICIHMRFSMCKINC